MIRVEIRCCCQPSRLLGTVPVVANGRDGQKAVFLLPVSADQSGHVQTITLEWGVYMDQNGAATPALKSRDMPIERLRDIPGFEESFTEWLRKPNHP